MNNNIILYLSNKFDIYISILDVHILTKDNIVIFTKDNLINIYCQLLNDNNIYCSTIIFIDNKIHLKIEYENIKQKIVISSFYSKPYNEIILLDNLININDSMQNEKIKLYDNNKIIDKTIIIMDIIQLLCYEYILDDELENIIIQNLDIIKINFKENKQSEISKKLFEIDYIKFNELIKKNNYWYEILFDLNYNSQLFLNNNSKNMIELYILIIYDKYSIIDDINNIVEILTIYEMNKYNIFYIKTVFDILQILNNYGMEKSINIGILIKRYYHIDTKIIEYAINFYNNIYSDMIDIQKILYIIKDNLLNEFRFNKFLDIPKYKNNLNKYQNIMIYVYSDLYKLTEYNNNILENIFIKYMQHFDVYNYIIL